MPTTIKILEEIINDSFIELKKATIEANISNQLYIKAKGCLQVAQNNKTSSELNRVEKESVLLGQLEELALAIYQQE